MSLIARLIEAGTPPDLIEEVVDTLGLRKPEREARKGQSWRSRRFAQLCERDGAHCQDCGCHHRTIWRKAGVANAPVDGFIFSRVNCSSNLEVDHRTPLSEGGSNVLDNLWLLCIDCHKRKTIAERSARLKGMFADWREAQSA